MLNDCDRIGERRINNELANEQDCNQECCVSTRPIEPFPFGFRNLWISDPSQANARFPSPPNFFELSGGIHHRLSCRLSAYQTLASSKPPED